MKKSSKNRLTPQQESLFPGSSLFDKIARAVCRAGTLPRKELHEAWEMAKRVRRIYRGGRVLDLACGHGLLAHIMLILDDTSSSALAVDRKIPLNAKKLSNALITSWPRLENRIIFKEVNLQTISVLPDDIVISAHACGSLTDLIIDKAIEQHASAQWAIELLASKRYKRYLKTTSANRIKINRDAVKEAERYDGKWVLETNDDTITVEDAARGYKGLMIIERCFRSLKRTQIKMTPMYHWADRRIKTHVKICVLALLIERVAEIACSKSWFHIRRSLEKLQATECHGTDHMFFKLNEVVHEVKETFNILEIPLPAGIVGISNMQKR